MLLDSDLIFVLGRPQQVHLDAGEAGEAGEAAGLWGRLGVLGRWEKWICHGKMVMSWDWCRENNVSLMEAAKVVISREWIHITALTM